MLIDTGPDLREQLLVRRCRPGRRGRLHARACRPHPWHRRSARLAIDKRRLIDIHADATTATLLRRRFGYCFETPPGSQYPPILTLHGLTAGEITVIDGAGGPIELLPFRQRHGDIDSLGFRVGGLAYSGDLNGLPDESVALLGGLDMWIVDALRPLPHPSHWCLAETLDWIGRIRPRRAILTNMHTELDYRSLAEALPDGVEPAYDGLRIVF